MRRVFILSLVAVTALTACNRGGKGNPWGNRQLFDGQYFRVKLDSDKDDRRQFVVTVNDAGKSLVGARTAAITKASEHCVKGFGTSDMVWEVSPEVEDAELPLVNGDLVLKGTCDGWR
ncbi:hypothetical protein [Pseudooceanicola sp.]|uniref:hypothetical protein n=1 Tax=Pseudooceanicola sp. TaxID=1914328 RepID=UPI0035C71528